MAGRDAHSATCRKRKRMGGMIIAFSPHSTRPLARLFCRRFRHCCVLFPACGGEYTLVQIGVDGVRLVPVGRREIRIMKNKGWKFVGARANAPFCWAQTRVPTQSKIAVGGHIAPLQLLTCVGFAKRALGIRNPFIWTPDGLYRRLCRRIRKHPVS